jgi:hypothetical protein
MAQFMGHFNSNLAREAGRLAHWREKFWGRHYQGHPSEEEAAQSERLRYILAQAGSYLVQLTATNSAGSSSSAKQIKVVALKADFNFSAGNPDDPKMIDHLHRPVDGPPLRLVVELRGRRHQHGAEPDPHLHQPGDLLRLPDGDERQPVRHHEQAGAGALVPYKS